MGAGSVHAQRNDQTLVISNLGKLTGKLYIGWYNTAADFRKSNKAVLNKVVATSGKDSIPVIFENVMPGIYAVAVFLDENDNGKIDTNILGIPKEKYGFSNNIHPLMRPASFRESAFTITNSKESIIIRLK